MIVLTDAPDRCVDLSVPKNTSSGRTFPPQGQGIAEGRRHRDLFVTTRIMLRTGTMPNSRR